MNVQVLHQNKLVVLTQTEQSMVWLVEHGPIVKAPPIPSWALKSLVKQERISRISKDIYLAPNIQGEICSFAETLCWLSPAGYITGHAALALLGWTDQDYKKWDVVANARMSNIRYGPFIGHFIFSPSKVVTVQIPQRQVLMSQSETPRTHM
jgi:hypothetical protein